MKHPNSTANAGEIPKSMGPTILFQKKNMTVGRNPHYLYLVYMKSCKSWECNQTKPPQAFDWWISSINKAHLLGDETVGCEQHSLKLTKKHLKRWHRKRKGSCKHQLFKYNLWVWREGNLIHQAYSTLAEANLTLDPFPHIAAPGNHDAFIRNLTPCHPRTKPSSQPTPPLTYPPQKRTLSLGAR